VSREREELLWIQDLVVSFGGVPAVRGVTMSVHAGEMLAVVGESGSGKSVTALAAMGLLPKGVASIDHGSVLLRGVGHGDGSANLLAMSNSAVRSIRGKDIAMIFQEPMTSLNPVMTIGAQVIEALRLHSKVSSSEAKQRAAALLGEVGIERPLERMKQYPHEFSGGMRQRVMIAMALVCSPRVLLADEPTTALDATVQKQVLDLIHDLKQSRGLGVMLITHDLGVVSNYADSVCVMYSGRVVEHGPASAVLGRPMHPYTRALLKCRPELTSRVSRLVTVGDILADDREWAAVGSESFGVPWWPGRDSRGVEPRFIPVGADSHAVLVV
jgi:ABC-type dipeptide/oligopeptide/nickel transport system ATPase component